MGTGGIGSIGYVLIALANAATQLINGKISRNQQGKVAEQNYKLQVKMEENRQNFQLSINEKNAQTQRDLALENHRLRLIEQDNSFNNMCKQAEWTQFLMSWPLRTLPSVIRAEQVDDVNQGTVALRVIFAKSSDKFFSNLIFPDIERGLLEFTNIYPNIFNSYNIAFYHNGFKSDVSGGSITDNIHYALKGLPVIIVEADVDNLNNEVYISLTMWGLGSTRKSNYTMFRIPYEKKSVNDNVDLSYYRSLTDEILARIKYVVGCAYDMYNLIEYNLPPLLPKIAAFEQQQPRTRGCILNYAELKNAIAEQYDEIYSMVLSNNEREDAVSDKKLLQGFNKIVIHKIKMEYAESVKDMIPEEQYIKYLNDSVDSWVSIRSNDLTVDFFNHILNEDYSTTQYFSEEDLKYFYEIKGLCLSLSSDFAYKDIIDNILTFIENKKSEREEEPAKEVVQKEIVVSESKYLDMLEDKKNVILRKFFINHKERFYGLTNYPDSDMRAKWEQELFRLLKIKRYDGQVLASFFDLIGISEILITYTTSGIYHYNGKTKLYGFVDWRFFANSKLTAEYYSTFSLRKNIYLNGEKYCAAIYTDNPDAAIDALEKLQKALRDIGYCEKIQSRRKR